MSQGDHTPQDKDNVTAVVRLLRKTPRPKAEISLARAGLPTYLQKSIDWKQVAPLVDYINLMCYDLIDVTARQRWLNRLISTQQQVESLTTRSWLDSVGVP